MHVFIVIVIQGYNDILYIEQEELLGCCKEVQPNSVQGAAQDKDYWIKGVYTCIELFSY